MRYFLKLAYNGGNYHGWQSQPNAVGIQSVIEEALSTVLRDKIQITGAGRTDSGVHARVMYAHFDYEKEITDKRALCLSLNRLIGKDIAIYSVIDAEDNWHARFDATERTYKYFISYIKNPFLYPFFYKSSVILDLEEMNKAAEILIITKDFTSFAKLHSDVRTNLCNVTHAKWLPISEDPEASSFIGNLNHGIVFTITANRFLRNMVRAIVGSLFDIGRGKLSVTDFVKIIEKKDRCAAGISMPPEGLFLWDIRYPFELGHDDWLPLTW